MEAYSIVGRTIDLYVVPGTCLLQSLKLRLRNPSVREYGKPFYYLLVNVDILFKYKISYKVYKISNEIY